MIFCAILQNRNAETHKRVSTPHSALSTHIQMYMHTQKQKNIQIHKNVHRHTQSYEGLHMDVCLKTICTASCALSLISNMLF